MKLRETNYSTYRQNIKCAAFFITLLFSKFPFTTEDSFSIIAPSKCIMSSKPVLI